MKEIIRYRRRSTQGPCLSGMGMDKAICLMVIGELFNSQPDEIESFLKGEGVIE